MFAWHQSPGALDRLIPPWERVTVERRPESLGGGVIAILVMRAGPFRLRWVAEHRDLVDRGEDGGEFTDVQKSGPFARWTHRHVVRATGPGRCTLHDQIDYALPGGRPAEWLAGWHVRRKLRRMFDYRHDATRRAVAESLSEPRSGVAG